MLQAVIPLYSQIAVNSKEKEQTNIEMQMLVCIIMDGCVLGELVWAKK